MAARLSPKHDAKTREKIQISQLVNRLMDNAFGKVEMTSQQVRSAEILLRKSLPDLSSIEHAGPGGGPVLSVRRPYESVHGGGEGGRSPGEDAGGAG